mgnify:CR=1 FL=1
MKKGTRWTLLIVALLIGSMLLSACGGAEAPAAEEPAAEEPAAEEPAEEEEVEEPVRVALVLDGKIDDNGWNQAGYEGLISATEMLAPGVLHFTLAGVDCTLEPMVSSPGETGLFIIFADPTNGDTTYGGGRYLDFRLRDIRNGRLAIDFNRAYNPYCAYGDGYQCPIPPPENHLQTRVAAGERTFKEEF